MIQYLERQNLKVLSVVQEHCKQMECVNNGTHYSNSKCN